MAMSDTSPEAHQSPESVTSVFMLAGIQKCASCLHRPVTASLKLVCLCLASGVPVAAQSMMRAAHDGTAMKLAWVTLCDFRMFPEHIRLT